MSNKVEYYNDASGDYRWRVKNRENGEIVSASTEGFVDLRHAMDNYTFSLEPAVETIYPEGYHRGPDQVINLEGQDFREQEDADTAESGAGGSSDSSERSEDEDTGSADEDPVGEGHPEGQRDSGDLDDPGSLPASADGEQVAKGSRRQGRGTHH